MKGLYINHGPGSNEWFGVEKNDLDKLQLLMIEANKLDIFLSEGLWFGNEHVLRKNGISVVNFIQNKGDMVLANRGFVYWIKSHGNTVNSGWNLFGNDIEQIPMLLKRFEFNKINDLENIIYVKTFCYDLMLNLIAFPKRLLAQENFNAGFEKLVEIVKKFHEEEEKLKKEYLLEKVGRKFKTELNESLNVNN